MNMHTTSFDVRTSDLATRAPQPLDAEGWHETPAAIGIIAAVADLTAVAQRLAIMRAQNPQLSAIQDAAALVGSVTNSLVQKDFARGYEYRVGPSDGTCVVAGLWDALCDLRELAIDRQIKAEGLLPYTEAGLTQEQSDVSFARFIELDRNALSVAQAVCMALRSGRA